jgi:hypothetical protein
MTAICGVFVVLQAGISILLMCVCVCLCLCMHMCIYVCVSVCVCVYANVHVCMHVYMHACIYAYIYVFMYLYVKKCSSQARTIFLVRKNTAFSTAYCVCIYAYIQL